MTKKQSFISEVLIRKIPQIIGMYIASVWLAVEISDWMSGRFDLPNQFSSIVFVGMIALLPAVIVIAWGHGAKGDDKWSVFEKIIIPVNLIAAYFAVVSIIKPFDITANNASNPAIVQNADESIMEKRSIIDVETGEEKFFEVPKESYHQKLISYFWENKSNEQSLDWLSYGVAWLLVEDLKRTQFLTVFSPFSKGLLSQLEDKGFARGNHVPLSLALKVARTSSSQWIIRGSFNKKNDLIEFKAKLYNVKTGQKVKEIIASNENPLTALDLISKQIDGIILSSVGVAKQTIPQLALMEHTSKNFEAIKNIVLSLVSVYFDNNYSEGVEYGLKALSLDESFAMANVMVASYFGSLGDMQSAIQHIQKALDLDYKLYQEDIYFLKARLFSSQGHPKKSFKVMENLVKLYPNSVNALRSLGASYMTSGSDIEKAKKVYQKLYEIEGKNSSALVSLAKLYRLEDNQVKALQYLETYLSVNQTKTSAYLEMAAIYLQFGFLDKAQAMYDEASLYDNKDFQSEIGTAKVLKLKGKILESKMLLKSLLAQAKNDSQKVTLVYLLIDNYLDSGEITEASKLFPQLQQSGRKVMTPLSAIFQLDGLEVYLSVFKGEFEKTETILKRIKKDLKPPYDNLIGLLATKLYERTQDVKKYQNAVNEEKKFSDRFKTTFLDSEIIASNGVLKFWNKDYEGALDLFDSAIKEAKRSFVYLTNTEQVHDFLFLKAQALMSLEKYPKAIESLDAILLQNPVSARAHFQKAMIFQAIGDDLKMQNEIKAVDRIWKNADSDYIYYHDFVEFKKAL